MAAVYWSGVPLSVVCGSWSASARVVELAPASVLALGYWLGQLLGRQLVEVLGEEERSLLCR